MRCKWIWIIFWIVLIGRAWAGSFDAFGTGSRAIAMGGAYAALGEDIAGLYYNVATIAQVDRLEAEIGYINSTPRLVINGKRQDIDIHRGLNFGGIISTLIFKHRLSLGLNLFIPDDHLMRFLVLPINQPHSALTHNANHTMTCLLGTGFSITKWASIGAGVNILATEKGGVDFTIKEKAPSEGSLFSQLQPNYGAIAGVWFKPADWWRIGGSFRDKVEMVLKLPNNIHIPALKMFTENGIQILPKSELEVNASTHCHFSPRSFELGMAFEPINRWLISADLTYFEWNSMHSDAPYGVVDVKGGLSNIFPTAPGPVPDNPNFRNTLVPAFGTEYSAVKTDHWQFDVRAGYRFRPTPVPEQKTVNNYLDADTHIISTGFGVKGEDLSKYLPRWMELSGFFQYQYSAPRVYHKSSPTDIMGDLEFQQTWWGLGGSLVVRF